MDKNLVFVAVLHFIVGAGTPIVTALVVMPDAAMTSRSLWAMGIGGLVGGAGGLLAFFSTTYAASPVSKFVAK